MIINNYDNNKQINSKVIVTIVIIIIYFPPIQVALSNIFKLCLKVLMLLVFLRPSGVLFHIEGPIKESAFWPMFFEMVKLISDKYFLFLNCLDKLIQKLYSDNWEVV